MEKIANTNTCTADISISVVSHLQIGLVTQLLGDLQERCQGSSFELILTLNLDEALPFALDGFSYVIKLVRNVVPLGFAANHNQAFTHATGRYFCVMNPDIRLSTDPFGALLDGLSDRSVGVVAPVVFGGNGDIEDSARRFPNPLKILCKVFGRCGGPDYAINELPVCADWVGGMFMLFPRSIFERLGGFDERYFLYYEDVDICGRLRLLGHEVVICPQAKVTHHAQRSSHGSFRYLRWHLRSMARFFFSTVYWRLQFRPGL
jgi:N-acetylglucosaminyl-diphospho-decaprenol L-rhamnosyltransferase